MNAIGYVRISKEKQSVHSLSNQKTAIKQYCQRNNLELLEIYIDDGERSDTFDRPDYIALEKFIKSHRGQVQYLIVSDHDRFSRNLPEALTKIKTLETKYALKVLSTDEPLNIDTSDPDVFMMRAFKYLLANSELFRIRKRTSGNIRAALESGRYVNRAPFGYINVKDKDGRGMLIIDDKSSFIISKMFQDILLGKSIMEVYKDIVELGFPHKGNSSVQRILTNCVYAGLIKLPATKQTPEKFVKGIHEPIISETTYWRVQSVLEKKPVKKMLRDEVPLRGLLKCWCGASMTASASKGRSRHYTYYRCRIHDGLSIPANAIHEKMEEIIEHLNWTSEQAEELQKTVKAKLSLSLETQKKQLAIKSEQLSELAKKIDSLEERMINGVIDIQTYSKWNKKFNIEKATLENQIITLKENQDTVWRKYEKILPQLTNLSELYRRCNVHQKQILLNQWFQPTLAYENGSFGTTILHPAFTHNAVKMKEKGLLKFKEPSTDLGVTPVRSEIGS